MTKANLKVVEDKKLDSAEKTKALDVANSCMEDPINWDAKETSTLAF